jgi:hypothetical protein
VLCIALAAYLAALAMVQRAAPRGLRARALVGRLALAFGALVLAHFGQDLGADAVVGIAAGALLVEAVVEARA